MKVLLIFILTLIVGISCKSQYLGVSEITARPLIIIAGESNAGGAGINASLSSTESAARYSLRILNNTSLLFEPMQIGVNNLILHQGLTTNGSHGIENGLANSCDSSRLGVTPIYFLKAGSGGARIAWWNDSTIIYQSVNAWEQLKTRADSAIKLMTAINNGIAPPLYLFWTQGINNNIDGTNATSWKDSTKSFFAKFRLRYGANVPIFMTYLPPNYSSYNSSITDISNEINYCYPIVVSDVELNGDNIHWSYAGWKKIATRFITSLLSHYTYY